MTQTKAIRRILFYSRKDEYGWLSNFERSKQVIDGVEYQTNEHYYQSQKARDPAVRDWIRNTSAPYLAVKAGRSLRPDEMVDNWDTKKFEVMYKGLLAKFSQNESLKQKLLDTGDAVLHEDSPVDMIWGIRGKDMLGKLLMKIRDELKRCNRGRTRSITSKLVTNNSAKDIVGRGHAKTVTNNRCPDANGKLCVEIVAKAKLPSLFGDFEIVAFFNNKEDKEQVALVKGTVATRDNVPVRLHSECLTGDVLGSLRCDCREQLYSALEYLGKQDSGVLLYMRQEGRGIGLINKVKAYYLQEHGYDTVEANMVLGFKDDIREYHIAADMLKLLGVRSIQILTNNPRKIDGLRRHDISISSRLPLEVKPNPYNEFYLKTKKEKSGHLINLLNA